MSIKIYQKFWLGIIFIMMSYLAWGGSLLVGAIAIREKTRLLIFSSTILYLFNWGFFGAGLWLSGREGVHYAKSLFRKLWILLKPPVIKVFQKIVSAYRKVFSKLD